MPKIIDHDEERQKIVNDSVQYIADYGVVSLTLRDFAAYLNVTKGYLQHYYNSKEALILDTIDHLEYLFVEIMASDISDSFELLSHQLHQMLPADRRRRDLWRARLELGLLAKESEIIRICLSAWDNREYLAGVKLLKKTKSSRFSDDFKPTMAYRSLLALVYGCAVIINIKPKCITPGSQHTILDNAISGLS